MIFRHLRLLLWKNILIRKRKPYFQFLLEMGMMFVLPVCMMGLKFYMPDNFLKDKNMGPQRIETRMVPKKIFTVGYVPTSPGLDAFIQQLAKKDKSIAFVGYQSEKQLIEIHDSNDSQFQLALTFRLRVRSDSQFHVRDIQEVNIRPKAYYQSKSLWSNILEVDGCRTTSFQDPDGAVYTMYTFLKSVFNLTSHNISLRTEDISCVNPLHTTQFKLLIPALIIAAFLPGSCVLTMDLLQEKKNKLKESIELYGVSGYVYDISWYLLAFVQFILLSVVVTWMIFSMGEISVLPHLNPALMFALVLSYSLTVSSFSLCLCNFTTDVTTAVTLIVMWNIAQIGYVIFRMSQESSFDHPEYFYTPSFYYWIMVLGCHMIIEWEKLGRDLSWQMLTNSHTAHGNITLMKCIIMLIGISFVMLFMGTVFRLTLKYCKKLVSKIEILISKKKDSETQEKDETCFFMKVTDGDICIEYSSKDKSREEPIFEVYKDQTTVILGHPDSGKTEVFLTVIGAIYRKDTLVRLIGTATTRRQWQSVKNVGVSTQYNSLIGSLSVHENLYFYTQLRGTNKSQLTSLIKSCVEESHLQAWAHVRADRLPKLWRNIFNFVLVNMNSHQILILDEPDHGLTGHQLDQFLQIVQPRLNNKTVLLTTTSTTTALRLANSIAVIAERNIACFGPVPFVQALFGAGYKLSLALGPESDIEVLRHYLHLYIQTYSVHHVDEDTMDVILPESFAPLYEFLWGNLNSKGRDLGVETFTIDRVDMQDIFSKLHDFQTFKVYFQSMMKKRSAIELDTLLNSLLNYEDGPKKLYSTLSESFKYRNSSVSLWSIKEKESSSNWLVSSFKNISSFLQSNSLLTTTDTSYLPRT